MIVALTYSNYHTIIIDISISSDCVHNIMILKVKKDGGWFAELMFLFSELPGMKTFPADRQIFPGSGFKTGKNY
jgi:hypothetical protein